MLASSSAIKRIVLNDMSSDIRELLLTPAQLSLVRIIANNSYTTSFIVSNVQLISIGNASKKLNRLFDKGYLLREKKRIAGGDFEYRYTAVKFDPCSKV